MIRSGAFVVLATVVSMPLYALSGIATFADDCTTPKTTFNLGDTVCAKAIGLTGFRFQWVDPSGFSVSTTDITTDPQADAFQLPTSSQSSIGGFFIANNLGHWRVNAITRRNSSNIAAVFTVKDPANAKVDLSIVKSITGSTAPEPGGPVQFVVTIVNNGPDDAVNTHFVDNIFSNATLDSLVQNDGPAFTCNGTDCQIASFPNSAEATFTINMTAGTQAAVVSNTASVSSNTPETNPDDNSSTVGDVPIGVTINPTSCSPQITAPPNVTLTSPPTSCSFTITDLDATLGTATASDNCTIVGGITRSGVPDGNVFPVGITTITYAISDDQDASAVATQTVTVVDNTPPAISCPQNITLEPTCPSGAVATWTEPVGTDNCTPTTTQTSGPVSGTVFPIGTTSVAYDVSDPSGNHASCSFTVTVLTVAATIQNLEASINASTLTGEQKQGLLPKLDAVLDAINRGNSKPACNVLSAFTSAVQVHMSHGDVPAAVGQAWLDSANHIGNAIGCTSNPCM